jgi:hypothetical protein
VCPKTAMVAENASREPLNLTKEFMDWIPSFWVGQRTGRYSVHVKHLTHKLQVKQPDRK